MQSALHVVGFETGWPHWLAHGGEPDLADSTRAILCDTTVVVLDLARRGEGVALVRSSFAADALRRQDLSVPFEQALARSGLTLPGRRAGPQATNSGAEPQHG